MPFAAYSWGTTVDPVTPGLTARPYVAREVLPYGTPPSVNLVAALDRRIQLGIFEPASLVPVARLLGVGTVALRADLDQSGRFGNPPVETAVAIPDRVPIDGLDAPRSLGPATSRTRGGRRGPVGRAVRRPTTRSRSCAPHRPRRRWCWPVTATASSTRPPPGSWSATRSCSTAPPSTTPSWTPPSTTGPTSCSPTRTVGGSRRGSTRSTTPAARPSGPVETAPDPTGYDFRLDPFPGATDDDRTVAEQVGGTVEATSEGGPDRPEDRAAAAVDGDVTTAWRVAGPDPRGQSMTLIPDGRVSRPTRCASARPRAPGRWRGSASSSTARRPSTSSSGRRPAAGRARRSRWPGVDPSRASRSRSSTPRRPRPPRRTPRRSASPRSGWPTSGWTRSSGCPSTCSTGWGSGWTSHPLDVVLEPPAARPARHRPARRGAPPRSPVRPPGRAQRFELAGTARPVDGSTAAARLRVQERPARRRRPTGPDPGRARILGR